MVPVAVRPAYCSRQTRPVKKLCPSLLHILRGSRAPSTFCPALRYQTSLLFGRCGSPFAVHTWSTLGLVDNSNNILTYWPEPSARPAHFQLLPFSSPSPSASSSPQPRAAVPGVFWCCYFQGCQDCNVGPSSSCAVTANPGCLCPFALLSALSACPLLARCLSASLVFAAHLCVPNSCAPKKEHKRVGRAHSPSINTLTAYVYPAVFEPIVPCAGVERVPLDTATAGRLVTAVSLDLNTPC